MEKFISSENFKDKVRKIFPHFKTQILNILPKADVQHMGGTAIPGALTKGDIDIQIRIPQDQFDNAVKMLKARFKEHNLEFWTPSFAIFIDNDEFPQEDKVDMLLTAIDSPSDVCHLYRNLLSNNDELLALYNQMKVDSEEKSKEEYAKAKDMMYKKLNSVLKR